MFCWVLNASLIICGFFLLLWVEASILNLPRIFLSSLVFYLSIQSRNVSLKCNKIMFETSQNFAMRNQNGLQLVSEGLYLEHVYNWLAVSTSDND